MSFNDNVLRDSLVTLLKSRSVISGDFVLSSGRRSSYYIDARRTTMSATGLDLIGRLGIARLRSLGWNAASIGGLTLGADPVAYAIAAASLREPPVIDAFTVRKEPKSHGLGRLIEGCFEPAARVIVVEDVVTTGGSALRALKAVRAAGGTPVGVLGVIDRDEGGLDAIRGDGVPADAMVTIHDLGVVAS